MTPLNRLSDDGAACSLVQASQKYLKGEPLQAHEKQQLDTRIDLWRNRLHSISWFVKLLIENIARQANNEDNCTGYF